MFYPSDLSDQDWEVVEPLLPRPAATGRPREVDFRQIVNAIFYQTRTGCQWRYLPRDFSAKSTVNRYYQLWQRDGTWDRILTVLRQEARTRIEVFDSRGRHLGVIDPRSGLQTKPAVPGRKIDPDGR